MENLNYVLDVLVAAREKLKDNDLHHGILKNQIGEAFEILVSEIDKTSSENEVLNWNKAKAYLDEVRSNYTEIGASGLIALQLTINPLLVRYEKKERSKTLYDEIMDLS